MAAPRLIADDLTGALDAAAAFVPAAGPVPVFFAPPPGLPAAAAISAITRRAVGASASLVPALLAPVLEDAAPALLKLDSLLRGPIAPMLAGLRDGFAHVVIAPAFPAQGRVTRAGRQFRAEARHWHDVGVDLPAALAAEGLAAARCRPGEAAPPGISLWDAETEADLDAVVRAGRALAGPVLWCGSAGLAAALADRAAVPCPALPPPLLALIGSDHPVSVGQLSSAWKYVHRLLRGDPEEIAPLARRLARGNAAAAVVVPPGLTRAAAGARIAAIFARVLGGIDRPGTLMVAGGDTLRGVVETLGARSLLVIGERGPGVPVSVLAGGAWDGQRVLSRSGAFGDSGWLLRLLAETPG
ncbi:MAG: four-carbon acid sugar kinase family protein [Acetobacteraceae bacterium]